MNFLNLSIIIITIGIYLWLVEAIGVNDPSAILVDFIFGSVVFFVIILNVKELLTKKTIIDNKTKPSLEYLLNEGFITINPITKNINVDNCPFDLNVCYWDKIIVISYTDDPTRILAIKK